MHFVRPQRTRHATRHSHHSYPQHRHHGSHRCGQDHVRRADSLLHGPASRERGEVHDGNTELDHLPEEKAKGITITAAATTVSWKEHRPAAHRHARPHRLHHRSRTQLCACSTAPYSCSMPAAASNANRRAVWRQAERHRVPRIAFVNKTDQARRRRGCVPARSRREARRTSAPRHVGRSTAGGCSSTSFVGWSSRSTAEGAFAETKPSPAESAAIEQARARVVEACGEVDDEVLALYCAGLEVPVATLERALRRGTLDGSFLVVLCGSALQNRGIQQLLDAVVAYLPSPARSRRTGARRRSAHGARLQDGERQERRLRHIRSYLFRHALSRPGGVGSRLVNAENAFSRCICSMPDSGERIESAGAGAIVALTGIRSAPDG